MNDTKDQLEMLWQGLLSQVPEDIKSAFATLDLASQEIVIIHLRRMVNEDGWQIEQRIAAETALKVLQIGPDQDE